MSVDRKSYALHDWHEVVPGVVTSLKSDPVSVLSSVLPNNLDADRWSVHNLRMLLESSGLPVGCGDC